MRRDLQGPSDRETERSVATNALIGAVDILAWMETDALSLDIGAAAAVDGSASDDDLIGTDGSDDLNGLAGDDVLQGLGGGDRLIGGAGDDVLDGGAGVDTADFGAEGGPLGVIVKMARGQVVDTFGDVDAFISIENVSGGDESDVIVGDAADNALFGAGGADLLNGKSGGDALRGGGGRDRLIGGAGDDRLFGQAAADDLKGGGGDDRLVGGGGGDALRGGSGADTITSGGGADDARGGGGADDVSGGGGDDVLSGGRGDDALNGGSGVDIVDGDADNDRLNGAGGNDVLNGGAGDDFLVGGGGDDVFVFDVGWGDDVVRDFGRGGDGDLINLSRTGLAFDDLTIAAADGGALIENGANSIFLRGVDPTELSLNDFDFSGDGKIDPINSGDETKVTVPESEPVSVATTINGSDLISLDAFRADARFAGVDGGGYAVVVIDTGIDLDHPAFGRDRDGDGVSDRIVYSEDFSLETDGTPNDRQGHGTNVASIVGSGDADYLGVAPNVNIIALQALDSGGGGRATDIENALRWVVDNASAYNVVAVNLSLGPGDNVNVVGSRTPFADEFAALDQLGVITTAAAGNDFFRYQTAGVSSIAADPNAIGVGAVWADDPGRIVQWRSGAKDFDPSADDIVAFSQRSASVPTIFAPGALIVGAAPGGGIEEAGGTSQAAPVVAGVAALAQDIADQSLGRRLTPDEFESLLFESADQIFDGDGENDNVVNLNAPLPRINVLALAEAIVALDGGGPSPSPGDDFGAVPSDAGRLRIGGETAGSIERAGDIDWLRVSLSQGDAYRFDVVGAPFGANALDDSVVSLVDASGEVLATDDDGGDGFDARLEYTAQTDGVFYLAVRAYGGTVGDYVASATRASTGVDDDLAADASTTSVVRANAAAARGEIETFGDRDWHRLDAAAGVDYVVELRGEGGGSGLRDPYLRAYDADGALIGANDDGAGDLDARLTVSTIANGPIFLEAAGYAGGSVGRYALSVSSSADPNDIPADLSTSSRVDVGGVFDGELSPAGDRDWVGVSLVGGSVYDISLAGFGPDALRDPYLRVLGPDGRNLAENDDFDGQNARIEAFSPNETGMYYISAGSFSDAGEGGYRIAVDLVRSEPQDIPADATTASALAIGETVRSEIETAGDRDWHRVALQAGVTYDVGLVGDGPQPLNDTYLRVYDAASTLIALDDDGGDGLSSALRLTPSVSDAYFLSAAAFEDLDVGGYALSIAVATTADDFAGDATTTGVLAADDVALGEIEVAGDADWFAFDVVRGGVYQFDLFAVGPASSALADPVLALLDRFGSVLASNDDGGVGADARIVYTAGATETIFLEAAGSGDETGGYAIASTVLDVRIDDHPNAPTSSATLLPIGGSIVGDLENAGDIDVFGLVLSPGRVYELNVDGVSLIDPTLTLLNANGDALLFDDDDGGDLDAQLIFQVFSPGVYYAAAAGFDGVLEGSYEISLFDRGFVAASVALDDAFEFELADATAAEAHGFDATAAFDAGGADGGSERDGRASFDLSWISSDGLGDLAWRDADDFL